MRTNLHINSYVAADNLHDVVDSISAVDSDRKESVPPQSEVAMSDSQFAVSFIALIAFAGVLFFALPSEDDLRDQRKHGVPAAQCGVAGVLPNAEHPEHCGQ